MLGIITLDGSPVFDWRRLIIFRNNFRWFPILGLHSVHIEGVLVSHGEVGLMLFVSGGNRLGGALNDLGRLIRGLVHRYILVPSMWIRQERAIILLQGTLLVSALLDILQLLLNLVKAYSLFGRATGGL